MDRRRLQALVALSLTLAGVQPVVAIGSRRSAPTLRLAYDQVTRQPRTVIRTWLRTYVNGSAILCGLCAANYHPSEPPFGRYRLAIVEPLDAESQPGHRLYLVFLINNTRAARYLLDLHPDAHARWLVDLWAEL